MHARLNVLFVFVSVFYVLFLFLFLSFIIILLLFVSFFLFFMLFFCFVFVYTGAGGSPYIHINRCVRSHLRLPVLVRINKFIPYNIEII